MGYIYTKILYLILLINYSQKLREPKETQELIECPIISNINEDILKFNCSYYIKLDNFSYLTIDKNITFENITLKIYLFFSSIANKTINNLQEQKENTFENGIMTLNNAEITNQNE